MLAVKALASVQICTGSPEPCHSTIISRAGSNGDLCTVYVRSERCRESASATTSHLCNHLCVVSMRQKCSKWVVMNFLNKAFARLSRIKDSGNRFLYIISWEYET